MNRFVGFCVCDLEAHSACSNKRAAREPKGLTSVYSLRQKMWLLCTKLESIISKVGFNEIDSM